MTEADCYNPSFNEEDFRTSVLLPPETYNKIEEISILKGKYISDVICLACQDFINQHYDEEAAKLVEDDNYCLEKLINTLEKIRKQSERIESKIESLSLNTSPCLIEPPRTRDKRTGTVLLSAKGNNNFVQDKQTGRSSARMSSPKYPITCRLQD